MKVFREALEVQSAGGRPSFHQITDQVRRVVENSHIKDGICLVYTHHTTCSVMIQECSFDTTYTGLEYLQQDLWDIFEK